MDSSSVKSPGSPGRCGSSTSRQPHLEGSASMRIYSLDFDPLINSDLEVFCSFTRFLSGFLEYRDWPEWNPPQPTSVGSQLGSSTRFLCKAQPYPGVLPSPALEASPGGLWVLKVLLARTSQMLRLSLSVAEVVRSRNLNNLLRSACSCQSWAEANKPVELFSCTGGFSPAKKQKGCSLLCSGVWPAWFLCRWHHPRPSIPRLWCHVTWLCFLNLFTLPTLYSISAPPPLPSHLRSSSPRSLGAARFHFPSLSPLLWQNDDRISASGLKKKEKRKKPRHGFTNKAAYIS